MTTLEREIIEKFRQLDNAGQQRIRNFIEQETVARKQNRFDVNTWLAETDTVRVNFPDNAPSSTDLIYETREENDGNILRSLGFGNSTSDSSK